MIGEDGPLAPEDLRQHMQTALTLARRGLGQTWPNPTVGCVLVRGSWPVGRGWTQPGGRPHAETEALARAGDLAVGASVVVTLEPCVHHGATPPCVDALLRAGIRRAVIAVADPDPRVAGRGIERLRAAGVAVTTGVCAAEASRLNQGFILRITQRRPLFTLKVASTLDGRIATATGDSRWITGEAARQLGHQLRATHDAILIGSETALHDDPDLTCRLPGLERRSPVRIIADGRRRVPVTSRLMQTATRLPTWVLTREQPAGPSAPPALPEGVSLLTVDSDPDGNLDPRAMAQALADNGLTRVLIEGGGVLAASFLKAGLVDRLVWFHAPRIIGRDGRAAIASEGLFRLIEAFRFQRDRVWTVGEDVVETYDRMDG